MNAGLRDAHNLCWKLQLVLQGKARPSLLASYQVERRPHVEQMIVFSWLLGQIIMPTQRRIAFLRDLFFQIVNSIAPIRGALKGAVCFPARERLAGWSARCCPSHTF